MEEGAFWGIIDRSRRGEPGFESQRRRLREELEALVREEVADFDRILGEKVEEANTYDLWAAADLIAGPCSEDWFHYFRLWLVSMGRGVFELALRDPDTLAGVARDPRIEDFFFEALDHVVEEVVGPVRPGRTPGPTRGQQVPAAALPGRFPRLWSSARAREG